MKANLEELSRGSLGQLLLKYSWPALVSMTLNALYAVVDRVFIGQGCGVDAIAGLQLAMPVMMLLTAFGPLVGVGHATLLSIKLGLNDRVACEKILGETVALKVLSFAILIPLLYIFLDPVLDLCGAAKVTPGAREAAKVYLKIVLASNIFSHLAFGLSALQRAEGGAVKSMICMIAGFGTNLILDPVFIFGFKMGVAGAAWATDIAMAASCFTALAYYWRGACVVRLRLRRVWIYPQIIGRALAIGLAPFLQQLMSAAIVAALQMAFAKWMPDAESRTAEIASLGVFSSALVLVFMPVLGCQQGLQPIIGYNWGARNYRRVLGTLKLGFWVTTALCVVAWIVQVVPPFPTWIAKMFISSDHAQIVALSAHNLAIANCMVWCISFNVLATTYFQAIGRPTAAIILSLLRQGIVLLPIVIFLPSFMANKSLAIWLSMPISDVLCNVATILPLYLHMRFLKRVRSREETAS